MIDYFCPCYDNLSVSDCLKLERLQRRAALTCTGAITRSETDKLFFDVGWPKLVDRRKSFRINLLYKIMNNLTPDYLFDDFIKIQRRVSTYNFRTSCKLSIPFCKLAKYANSFFPSTLNLWNALPQHISGCQSLATFKNCFVSQFQLNKLSVLYNSFDG